jgi:hypothetical protein
MKTKQETTSVLSRRTVLQGAGVALALPFLDSLAPRSARSQVATPPKRFVAMNFPNGATTEFWKPHAVGRGSVWQLSPVLEPLLPVKSAVSVLNNVGNYGPFGGHIEPSHANNYAAFLTCTKPHGNMNGTVGISVDQVIANGIGAATKIPSLQVGLSTLDSYTDGLPGPCSRSVSWDANGAPLGKLIDPQMVFDKLVAAGPYPGTVLSGPDPLAQARRDANKSVLDYVMGHAATVQTKLGRSDRARLDQFLTSVRELEVDIQQGAMAPSCSVPMRSAESYTVNSVPPDYNRDLHANQMIDLVAMALQCDLTRVVTFALDDARSDFVYDFLYVRSFTPDGSTPTTMKDAGAHGISSAGDNNNGYATLNYWFVDKLSRLCQKLSSFIENDTFNVLDQSVVWFGSEMHGGNHDGLDLPVLYVGSGGGRLTTDQNLDLARGTTTPMPLANVYLTFIRGVFDLPVTQFGTPMGTHVGEGTTVVPELLA